MEVGGHSRMEVTQKSSYIAIEGLQVDIALFRFIEDEALPGTGVDTATFWHGLSNLLLEEREANEEFLNRRVALQSLIDHWHEERYGEPHDAAAYRLMLEQIGYLEPQGPDFEIETVGVDAEIGEIAGPQLVVPATNARYALNAANARWGSLYDALYGTNAVDGIAPAPGPYDSLRGQSVIDWVRSFLDEAVPLETGSFAEAVAFRVHEGVFVAEFEDRPATGLLRRSAFVGYRGSPDDPSSLILRNNRLHIELVIDRANVVGLQDRAGVADVLLESATTAIVDLEDSVAAVDAEEKVNGYRNWLGLMRGDLEAKFEKGGHVHTRCLNPNRDAVRPDGSPFSLRGRALLLVRNVGHLMTTPAILDQSGSELPEGLLDAMVTVLIAMHDMQRDDTVRNSLERSVYVVKPKMHGSREVAFADHIFARVESVLGLASGTVKIGLMDEERRTSLNLKECIRAARSRICFVNTGFLDRTGDEIHTSMSGGAMVRKADMKSTAWFNAYENNNVDIGLACGLRGRAQIGKGMWAAPDHMAQMLAEKIAHPRAGANCAWVPSPTAATLHATHYHRIDVKAEQERLAGVRRAAIDDLLTLPIYDGMTLSADDIAREVSNNAQGILGYVVRWIDQGVGCSKVPDINDVALMEDRATCRISSQHIANWLAHGIIDAATVLDIFKQMARVVDRQNSSDPEYVAMAPNFDRPSFHAACDLVFKGAEQPSGYTEPILHEWRRRHMEASQ